MNTITLDKEKIYSGNLILINANFPLVDFNKVKLIASDLKFPNILLKYEAANALQYIFNKIDCNKEIIPISGYRSSGEQASIYANSLRDNGKSFTNKYVALPNHSEHQSGLAIDLGTNKNDFIRPNFPYSGICNEFRKTAPLYGFIERYQNNKEKITGIAHEPWHFRYVGYPHSQIISKKRLALEEYIDFIKNYKYVDNTLKIQNKEKQIEVFYVPFDGVKSITAEIPERCKYQVSGNNIDGFIVTFWSNCNE